MRAERAASFARVADAYERARPGYPADAVLWLAGETPCDVVDLGAGTGKLTRSLAALGHHVVAIEPLAEMLDVLRSALPGVTAVAGTAESMPLPAGSADVVVCAQAFHWFDHGPALVEIARVLTVLSGRAKGTEVRQAASEAQAAQAEGEAPKSKKTKSKTPAKAKKE